MRCLLSLASLIGLAGLVRAAEVAPFVVPATPPSSGSIDATIIVATTTATAGSAKRVVSPKTAAKLVAATPQFQPPAEAVMVPTPESVSPMFRASFRSNDTRQQIVQLPRFIVREPRLPGSLQVLTTKGHEELAFQRRPGLRMVPLAQMNTNIGLELLDDDLRAERAREAALWMSLYTIK